MTSTVSKGSLSAQASSDDTRHRLTFAILGEAVADGQAGSPAANNDIVILVGNLLGSLEDPGVLRPMRPGRCELRGGGQERDGGVLQRRHDEMIKLDGGWLGPGLGGSKGVRRSRDTGWRVASMLLRGWSGGWPFISRPALSCRSTAFSCFLGFIYLNPPTTI